MAKYTLIKQPDERNMYDIDTVTMEFETEMLTDLLEHYKRFLLACGYIIEGEIVEETEDEQGLDELLATVPEDEDLDEDDGGDIY